ncbi:MAG: hypothetical protein H8E15_00435 [Planctomycetes bacterium]|nr:hypothetical protein [Planctomycetota bacterium]
MAHEPDEPAVGNLTTITVVGSVVALVLAFLAAAVSNQLEHGIPDNYSQSQSK